VINPVAKSWVIPFFRSLHMCLIEICKCSSLKIAFNVTVGKTNVPYIEIVDYLVVDYIYIYYYFVNYYDNQS